jgi:hypothetical protein
LKVYALRRAGGGLLATRVALAHTGRIVRPLLAVDTGSLYTIVEPTFIAALGIALTQSVETIDVMGIGGRLRLPCFVLERLHCFGMPLAEVRVLALDFSRILPSIHGVLGLRELHASQATVDLARNIVTTPS